MTGPIHDVKWGDLERWAREEVEATLEALPLPLRESSRLVPVTYERKPDPALVKDGIEPDSLGLFVGPTHGEELTAATGVPSQILLFLENLWDYAEGETDVYREEVHTTYLHELGHYLGLDEEDLGERGLD